MLFRDKGFKLVVKNAWEEAKGDSSSLKETLLHCSNKLQQWNNSSFGNVQKKIRTLKERIKQLKDMPRTEESIRKEMEATEELDEWFIREELLWKQRSRADWLKEGEQNALFFRARASRRKERKIIQMLSRDDGTETNDLEEIMGSFSGYFITIFSSSFAGGINSEWAQVMNVIQPKVPREMNDKLTEPYTTEEIRKALFQMHPENPQR